MDLPCAYEDHTADIEDNRILSWTLFVIVRSGSLTWRELPNVRRAYRTLQGAVQTYPVGPESCVGRTLQPVERGLRTHARPLQVLPGEQRSHPREGGPVHAPLPGEHAPPLRDSSCRSG